jgi:hypothetical protein
LLGLQEETTKKQEEESYNYKGRNHGRNIGLRNCK